MEFDDVDEIDTIPVNIDVEFAQQAVQALLKAVGEDPDREGLKNTPDRVARMYAELLSGYHVKPSKDYQWRLVQY